MDRAASLEGLRQLTSGFQKPVAENADVGQALDHALAMADREDLVLVSGSLFTVGEAELIYSKRAWFALDLFFLRPYFHFILLVSLVLSASPRAGFLFPAPGTSGSPIRIRADHIVYDGRDDSYLAEGKVEVWEGNRKLVADRIFLNGRTSRRRPPAT